MHRVSVVTNAIMNVTIRRNSHGSPVVTQFDPSAHVEHDVEVKLVSTLAPDGSVDMLV